MKTCSQSLIYALLLISLTTVTLADPAPSCGPNGCQKPGAHQVVVPGGPDDPAPSCGPNGCQKPGLMPAALSAATSPDDPAPSCGPNGCQKPGIGLF